MALYHSGNSKLIEIDCFDFKLTFTGKPIDYKSEALKNNKEVNAITTISSSDKEKLRVEILENEKQIGANGEVISRPIFFEHGSYQIILEKKSEDNFEFIHRESDISGSIQAYGNVLVGTIEFKSEVGYSTFSVCKNGKIIFNITIEVFPSKLDYQTDYKDIMNEVDKEISSIIFKLIGNTVLRTKLKETENQTTNTEFLNIFINLFEGLESDVKRICNNLKHNVQTVEEVRSVEKSRIPSKKSIDYLRKHPRALMEDSRGFININNKSYLPNTIVDKRKKTTIDIFENQFVKYMVTTIVKRLDVIVDNICSTYKDEKRYTEFIKEKKAILNNYIRRQFKDISDLKGKKTMSLVFQMSPGYKDLYIKYQILKKGLAIGEGFYEITPKKLYDLYEIWCYVKINNILKELGFNMKEQSLIKYRDNGLFLSLLQDKNAKINYSNGETLIELWYQKLYSASPTTVQNPDTVLCIKNLNDKSDVVYIFDAKYRINTSGSIGPMEEDINVMHRYRDAIVSKMHPRNQFKYETFGAYVMFPYSGEEEVFKENEFYKSIEAVNIGAFPMLPNNTSLITEHLKKITGQVEIVKDKQELNNIINNEIVNKGIVEDVIGVNKCRQ